MNRRACFRARTGFGILLLWLLASSAQPAVPDLVAVKTTPPVNRTIPAHAAPIAAFVLSDNPSEQEIRHVRLFAEPLVPTGAVPSAAENHQLADALRRHTQRIVADDFSALDYFVANHSDSPWTPSLTFNLGMEYYKSGRYSEGVGRIGKRVAVA